MLLETLAGIGSAASAAFNTIGSFMHQNRMDSLAEQNYEYEKMNADRNFALQQEQVAWEKAKQEEAWKREDTAVQRRVADLRAAGLSPTLAAGSAASSSSPISIGAAQHANVKHEQTPYVAHSYSMMEAALGAASQYEQLMQQKANVSRTKAEEQLINMNIEKQKTENNVLAQTANSRINMSQLEFLNKQVLYNEHLSDSEKLRALGFMYGARSSDMVNFVNAVGGTQKALEYIKQLQPDFSSFGQILKNSLTDATGKLNSKVEEMVQDSVNGFFNTMTSVKNRLFGDGSQALFYKDKDGFHLGSPKNQHGINAGRSF